MQDGNVDGTRQRLGLASSPTEPARIISANTKARRPGAKGDTADAGADPAIWPTATPPSLFTLVSAEPFVFSVFFSCPAECRCPKNETSR